MTPGQISQTPALRDFCTDVHAESRHHFQQEDSVPKGCPYQYAGVSKYQGNETAWQKVFPRCETHVYVLHILDAPQFLSFLFFFRGGGGVRRRQCFWAQLTLQSQPPEQLEYRHVSLYLIPKFVSQHLETGLFQNRVLHLQIYVLRCAVGKKQQHVQIEMCEG